MSNIVAFPTQPTTPQVRISAGLVTASTDPRDVGRHMWFLTFVDADGTEAGVWDGYSHKDALAAAREWAADGVPFFDETAPVLH